MTNGFSCTGITTYLANELRGGASFTVVGPPIHTGRDAPKMGLMIGSQSDKQVEEFVNFNVPITDKRAILLMNELTRLGIRPLRAKVTVCVQEFGLSSIIDLVGIQGGDLVVIEQKCTQRTLSSLMQMYYSSCSVAPKLRNKLDNNTYNADQLQTAVGVMGLRLHFPDVVVKGLVIRCAEDGVVSFPMEEQFTTPTLFVRYTPKPMMKKKSAVIASSVQPKSKFVRQALARLGGGTIQPKSKHGSFVINQSAHVLVVSLVHSNDVGSKASQRKRDKAKDEAKRLWLRKKKKINVKGCVVYYTSRDGVYHHDHVSFHRSV